MSSAILCNLFNGCSRLIIHGEIREQMTEAGVELIPVRDEAGRSQKKIIPAHLYWNYKQFIRLQNGIVIRARRPFTLPLKRAEREVRFHCVQGGPE